MADELSWFGVRCLFRWGGREGRPFEERITLWQAKSLDDAIGLAEVEAAEYASANELTYLGLAQAYAMDSDAQPGRGVEVFSLLRDSELPAEEYLSAFFDTGREHSGG